MCKIEEGLFRGFNGGDNNGKSDTAEASPDFASIKNLVSQCNLLQYIKFCCSIGEWRPGGSFFAVSTTVPICSFPFSFQYRLSEPKTTVRIPRVNPVLRLETPPIMLDRICWLRVVVRKSGEIFSTTRCIRNLKPSTLCTLPVEMW